MPIVGIFLEYINSAFATNMVIPLGPNVTEFEKRMCDYSGKKRAVALSSGTAAIHLALKLAGVERGDIVFCQSLTFSASANPIMYQHATPVFIDSEEETWNMSPAALEKAFEKYPSCKVVILVHLFGVPGKIDEIKKIAKKIKVDFNDNNSDGFDFRENACRNITLRGDEHCEVEIYWSPSFPGNVQNNIKITWYEARLGPSNAKSEICVIPFKLIV